MFSGYTWVDYGIHIHMNTLVFYADILGIHIQIYT